MRVSILFVLFVIFSAVRAEVYTWVDADGNTHYSDKPPADQAAEQLDIEAGYVSTIGGSGLRPGEQALLEQIRQNEQAAAERRQREQEYRFLAEQRRLAEERERADESAENTLYRRVYPYRVIPHRAYRSESRFGLNLDYSSDNFRLRGSVGDGERGYRGPPRRPSHHFRHNDRVNHRNKGVTHGMSGTPGGASVTTAPGRLTP